MRYFEVPPSTICLVTDICAYSSKPMGDLDLSRLSNTIVTLALVTPACPRLYMRSCKFVARTVLIFVMPRTKHIASRIFDFPLPFKPVIELKLSSLVSCQLVGYDIGMFAHHPEMTVRTAYDLKPCDLIRYMVALTVNDTYVYYHFDYSHIGGALLCGVILACIYANA